MLYVIIRITYIINPLNTCIVTNFVTVTDFERKMAILLNNIENAYCVSDILCGGVNVT